MKYNKELSTLIYFYAEWCPLCQQFAPEWNKFKKIVTNNVNIVERSCVKYENYCSKIKLLNGYPTLYFIDSKSNKIKEYTGNRTANDLKDFVISNL